MIFASLNMYLVQAGLSASPTLPPWPTLAQKERGLEVVKTRPQEKPSRYNRLRDRLGGDRTTECVARQA